MGVLLLGMLTGLLLAAALGLVVLLFGTKHRTTAVLGRVPDTKMYRNLENYPEGKTYPGLLILRFDGVIFEKGLDAGGIIIGLPPRHEAEEEAVLFVVVTIDKQRVTSLIRVPDGGFGLSFGLRKHVVVARSDQHRGLRSKTLEIFPGHDDLSVERHD